MMDPISIVMKGVPVLAWVDDHGQPSEFASTQFGKAVGLSQPRMANIIKGLSEEDKGIRYANTLGGRQSFSTISRSATYQIAGQLKNRQLRSTVLKQLSDLAVASESNRPALVAAHQSRDEEIASLQSQIDQLTAALAQWPTAEQIAAAVVSGLTEVATRKTLSTLVEPVTFDTRIQLVKQFFEERVEDAPGEKLFTRIALPEICQYLRENGAPVYSDNLKGLPIAVGLLISRAIPREKRHVQRGYIYVRDSRLKPGLRLITNREAV